MEIIKIFTIKNGARDKNTYILISSRSWLHPLPYIPLNCKILNCPQNFLIIKFFQTLNIYSIVFPAMTKKWMEGKFFSQIRDKDFSLSIYQWRGFSIFSISMIKIRNHLYINDNILAREKIFPTKKRMTLRY